MENVKSDWDCGFVSGKLSAIRWYSVMIGICSTPKGGPEYNALNRRPAYPSCS